MQKEDFRLVINTQDSTLDDKKSCLDAYRILLAPSVFGVQEIRGLNDQTGLPLTIYEA